MNTYVYFQFGTRVQNVNENVEFEITSMLAPCGYSTISKWENVFGSIYSGSRKGNGLILPHPATMRGGKNRVRRFPKFSVCMIFRLSSNEPFRSQWAYKLARTLKAAGVQILNDRHKVGISIEMGHQAKKRRCRKGNVQLYLSTK